MLDVNSLTFLRAVGQSRDPVGGFATFSSLFTKGFLIIEQKIETASFTRVSQTNHCNGLFQNGFSLILVISSHLASHLASFGIMASEPKEQAREFSWNIRSPVRSSSLRLEAWLWLASLLVPVTFGDLLRFSPLAQHPHESWGRN